jgi:hypothetical protein
MRLLSLTAHNFRGFGSSAVNVGLGAELVLMFGPNGFCKTSFAEAIEWLFYGTTRRRERGEAYSKTEYDGCFANVHGGMPVEVSARVLTVGGTEHTLTRRISNPNADRVSETFIDGVPGEFPALGLSGIEGVHPVVAQHDLQSFIHSRPKERRDLISAALGLEEITTLKTSLDGARRAFTLTPPASVMAAREKLRPLAAVLATLPETRDLAQRWQKAAVEIRAAEDLACVVKAGQRLAISTTQHIEQLLEDLRARRKHLSRAVFDVTKITPRADIPSAIGRLTAEADAVQKACETIAADIAKAIAAAAAQYATTLLQFWELGLKLSPDGEICPMCEEPTLTAEKRVTLQARLKIAQDRLAGGRRLVTDRDAALTVLTSATQAMDNVGIAGVGEEERSTLQTLFTRNQEALAVFLSAHDDLKAAAEEAANKSTALRRFLSGLSDRLADATRAPDVVADSKDVPEGFSAAIGALRVAFQRYGTAWTTFEPLLSAQISSTKAIAEIDAVGKTLRAQAEIKTLSCYDAFALESRSLMQRVEAFLQQKQTSLLTTRGAEIKAVYDQLNPGARVTFQAMEPGHEQLQLHASSFGVRMSAAANLSECQLNCLGLSFWIVRALTSGSPFGFVLLDDPVQSMDDDHCEAFIGTVIPNLCDAHRKQVIVLSHEQRLIDRLRDLNRGRNTAVYHFDNYEITGPSITQQVNLAVMLAEVKCLAKGNEANRSEAVDKLRKVGEQFIRELHAKVLGQPAPAQYDNAKPGQLLDLFRQIGGTLPDEHDRLKDTFEFSALAHHKPVGYAVPVTTNITPHIDRLETLMKKYKLLL